tara:strand:+ start:345 stop:638 length:294 start_codon:yes stop_codon:yes gene_type:complete
MDGCIEDFSSGISFQGLGGGLHGGYSPMYDNTTLDFQQLGGGKKKRKSRKLKKSNRSRMISRSKKSRSRSNKKIYKKKSLSKKSLKKKSKKSRKSLK